MFAESSGVVLANSPDNQHLLIFRQRPEVVGDMEFELVGGFAEIGHRGDDGVADLLCVFGRVGVVDGAEDL